ncbi:MAG: hypothetical protein QOD29_219 [Alphaproteobacteria bacterium]|nr:hypothetical protein [Alphaproteobacteria bacterium]
MQFGQFRRLEFVTLLGGRGHYELTPELNWAGIPGGVSPCQEVNCWPASIYPLIIQRKNSEDARLILGKAAIRRQVACPKPIDDKGFSLFLGSAMIHL